MALTPTQRPTREWPLLILALALVGALSFPLWQALSFDAGPNNMFASWTPARWGQLFFGPEQILCYCCFTWAALILASRYAEVRRQRRAFALPLLPTEEGMRILHEDARPLQRRVEQINQERGPFILANMIRMALGKYIVSRGSRDVNDTVRSQAEVDHGRLVASLATVNYLVWAIPAIGFLGTVRGLAAGLTLQGQDTSDVEFLQRVTGYLNVAFDTTFIALFLSLILMFLVHSLQREEESLVIDCQQYCTEHLVNRLYEPESLGDAAADVAQLTQDLTHLPVTLGNRPTRLSS